MRCLPLEVAVCSVHLCQRSDPDRHSQTIPSPLTLLENILSLLLILPRLPTHRSLLLATFCLTELHLRCRGEKKQKETSNTPAHRVSSCCLWLTLWSGVLAVIVVDVNKLAGGRKKQGCWDYGKSQNSETEKFSNPRQWLFFFVIVVPAHNSWSTHMQWLWSKGSSSGVVSCLSWDQGEGEDTDALFSEWCPSFLFGSLIRSIHLLFVLFLHTVQATTGR